MDEGYNSFRLGKCEVRCSAWLQYLKSLALMVMMLTRLIRLRKMKRMSGWIDDDHEDDDEFGEHSPSKVTHYLFEAK